MKSYLEHVAIYVKDIHWHIKFFEEVLGMGCREIDGTHENPKQYWTLGGIQLISKPDLDCSLGEGRFAHLGIFCQDVALALERAKAYGVVEDYRGKNWIHLPDGLFLELMQAKGRSVEKALAADPRQDDTEERISSAMPTITDKYWDDVSIGDEAISPSMKVTSEIIMNFAELTGDFTPVHTDENYAKTTPFGTRVAHGLLGLSIVDGLKTNSVLRFVPGMSLGWEWKFVAPIKLNDMVKVRFRVADKRLSKSQKGWGIVNLQTELLNQNDEVVQQGEHRLMIPLRG